MKLGKKLKKQRPENETSYSYSDISSSGSSRPKSINPLKRVTLKASGSNQAVATDATGNYLRNFMVIIIHSLLFYLSLRYTLLVDY